MQAIQDWTLVYRENEAILFSFEKPCKIHTTAMVQTSDSFASMIDHATENLIYVNDDLINEILDFATSSGVPIADNVRPAFEAYLMSDVESPSAETITKAMALLGA